MRDLAGRHLIAWHEKSVCARTRLRNASGRGRALAARAVKQRRDEDAGSQEARSGR
jgi:hypothetical protein